MELKKSKEANLENKKVGFQILGLILGGALVLMAFSYKTVEIIPIEKKIVKKETAKEEILEEFIPNEPPPPPPVQQAPPPIITEVKEVDNKIKIEPPVNLDEELRDFEFEPDEEVKVVKKQIFDVVSVNPEFPGGDAEMARFIDDTFEYPEISQEMGEQGTVYIEFVVNDDGSIEQVKVVKPVSKAIDAEAIRVVKKMPKWKPGEQAGKPVNVRYTIPIKVSLGR